MFLLFFCVLVSPETTSQIIPKCKISFLNTELLERVSHTVANNFRDIAFICPSENCAKHEPEKEMACASCCAPTENIEFFRVSVCYHKPKNFSLHAISFLFNFSNRLKQMQKAFDKVKKILFVFQIQITFLLQ